MTLEFDVDIGYITDDGSKDMPQWVKLNDEDGQHPSTVYVNNDSYQRSISENAKLRKLVRWMYDRMDESCAAQHPYAPAPISYDRLMQALARAHELGIEVGE